MCTLQHNLQCTKRSQMITPDKLFSLPQDVYLERGKPKSDEQSFKKFLEKIDAIKPQNDDEK